MKDFSNASFAPETIGLMENAMDAAVATLPHPVSSANVNAIAETILRTARDGERDPYDAAKNGANGTSDFTARLASCNLFTKPVNCPKTSFPKWPETNSH
jgi:hypothetical protein